MLRALVEVRSVAWVVPTVGVLCPAPAYYTASLGLRLLKPLLSAERLAALDDLLYHSYQSHILAFFETFSGVQLRLAGDLAGEAAAEEAGESVVVMANHQSTMDWAVADMVAVRRGALGHLRYVLKSSLQYLPLYGWYFWLHGCVYVRRQGSLKAQRTAAQLAHLAHGGPRSSWLVLFPEGTRFRPASRALKESQAFASGQGLPPLSRVLFPRYRGLELVLGALGGKLSAVYDLTIAYSQSEGGRRTAPTMGDFATAPPGASVSVHLRRIPLGEVPRGGAELQSWLYERFAEKERLLAAHAESGAFPGERDAAAWPAARTLGHAALWLAAASPFYLTETGRKLALFIALPCSLANVLYLKACKAI